MTNTLLLISNNPEDLAFAQGAASTSGLTLKVVPDGAQGAQIVANEEPRVLFVDASTQDLYQKFETAIHSTVGLFSDKVNANTIHFITSENIDKIQYLLQSPLFGNLISRNYGDPKSDGEHYGRLLKGTLVDKAFGLSTFLKPEAKVQVVKLQRTIQKQDAVEAVKNYFLAAKFQTRMATVIANAVDELLMNAMFDAPVDELGKSLYSNLPRTTDMELSSKQTVEMLVGYDGNYAAVTAVDHFGSLDKSKLLSHISKIYTEEEYKVRTSVAGAGLGLATLFRSGGSFIFVSESRVKTEVTVLFKRTDNFREFRDQFRYLITQFYF